MPLVHHDFDYWDGVTGHASVTVTLYDDAQNVIAPSPFALAEIGATGRYVASAAGLPAGIYVSAVTVNGSVVSRGGVFRWDGTQEVDPTAAAVWDEPLSAHITAGTFGEALGFQLETTLFWRLLTTTYSGTPSRPTYMLAAAYPSKADADADINRRYTVQIDQTFNASGDLLTSKRTRI